MVSSEKTDEDTISRAFSKPFKEESVKMKKRTLVVILALLALILSSCSSGGNNVSRTYDEALNAMMQGKYAEAADKLSGISFYQDSVQLALYCRAHAWAGEGRYADAIAELTKLGSFRDAEKAAVYFTARMEEDNADTPVLRAYAAALYDADMINGFRDSMSRAEAIRSKLYAEGEAAEKAEAWAEAAGIFEPLGSYRESYRRWRYATGRKYEADAETNPESWGFAVVYYDTAHDYRDSEERMERCQATAYRKADELIAAEDFDAAERIYLALGTYCDPDKHVQLMEAARRAKIAKADALMEEKQFDEARALYLEAGETEMADEALYRKAEDTALNGDIEEAAGIYMNVRDHKAGQVPGGKGSRNGQPDPAAGPGVGLCEGRPVRHRPEGDGAGELSAVHLHLYRVPGRAGLHPADEERPVSLRPDPDGRRQPGQGGGDLRQPVRHRQRRTVREHGPLRRGGKAGGGRTV